MADDRRVVLLIIGGYAGSGKTELSHRLARLTRWAVLDKDSTTQPLIEAALRHSGESPDDREGKFYRSILRPAEYDALWRCTQENIDCGVSVVMVAPFSRELKDHAWCDRAAAEFGRRGALVHAVWVRSDAGSMRTRILHRGAPRDRGKLANWDQYVAGLDFDYIPAMPYTIVDNSLSGRPLQQQAEQLLLSLGVAPENLLEQ